jgi:hypothetical protein
MIKRFSRSIVAAGALVLSATALAHHSTAGYDFNQNKELTGVVKSFQWTNPHNFLQILVPDGKGGQVEWAVEAGAPEMARRLGWSKDAVKAGDKITVVVAPARSGSPEGTLKSAKLPDGRMVYGPGNRPAGAPASSIVPTLERATTDEH